MAVFAEEAWRAKVMASTGLTDLIGTRLSPWGASERDVFPYGTYYRLPSEAAVSLGSATSHMTVRLQADWYSRDVGEVMDIGDLARLATDNYIGAVTVGSTSLRVKIKFTGDNLTPINEGDGKDSLIYRLTQEYVVGHNITPASV